jgi:uncharacterized protein YhaN
MHIADIMLRDFGTEVFRDARLDGIENGLTVVGGPQRAGKTTFLEAVRRLGYGIEPGADLPPPADEYNVRATVRHQGYEYILKLKGHSDPTVVTVGDGPDVSVRDLYGSVSKTQYQQLFTITLDELKRLPETVDDAEDLSEVLLGAAYGDVSIIPDMESAFADRAYEIGRSYGKPTKQSELRNPIDKIQQGMDNRDEANEQLDKWGEARKDHREIKNEIQTVESEIEQLKYREERLSVIADGFKSWQESRQLGEALQSDDLEQATSLPDDAVSRANSLLDAYDDAIKERDPLKRDLTTTSPNDGVSDYKEDLLEHRSDIKTYDRKIEKWKEQSKQIEQRRQGLDKKRADLQRRVGNIHPDWDGDFEDVLAIETGTLTTDEVGSAVEEHDEAVSERRRQRDKQRQLTDRLQTIDEQLTAARNDRDGTSTTGTVLKQAGGVGVTALLIAVAGSVAGFPLVGGIVGALVLLGVLYAITTRTEMDSDEPEPIQELKAEKRNGETELDVTNNELERAEERAQSAEEQLDRIAEQIGLPSTVSPDGVQAFYEETEECQTDIRELREQETALRESRDKLMNELSSAAETMREVRLEQWDDEAPVDDIDTLTTAIETAYDDLEVAEDLDEVEGRIDELEEKIKTLLSEWDAVDDIDAASTGSETIRAALVAFRDKAEAAESILEQVDRKEEIEQRLESNLQTGSTQEAFEAVANSGESLLDVFERIAIEYDSAEAVRDELAEVHSRLDEKDNSLEKSNERRLDLERKLEQLKSDDDIVEARGQITEGRQELRELGEEYAVNRIAEHLTGRLHERFIEKVAGPLIDEASEIFQKITQEYEGISHNDQFDNLDFEALREGKPAHGTGELSRATAEQLFLAVRLARIRQLDVSLPVVMDDAMTNFDPAHGARTLQIISELADTNQVFFLTCHPEHVMLAEAYGEAEQFWCLDDGRFSGPYTDSDRLYDLLHTESGASVKAE